MRHLLKKYIAESPDWLAEWENCLAKPELSSYSIAPWPSMFDCPKQRKL